ncbi:MAG: PorV/PorQ family protein [Bacteroidetes bacterium]|nr:PorV/PorQ family protein [Bacteroidota bacterium]
MNYIHLKRFTFSLLVCTSTILFAQAPKYSNEFLSVGVGARALGMSNAVVASVNDVTSGYWNPAGLVHMNSNVQVGLMHSEYFAGIAKYDYGSFAFKIDSSSAIGFSLIRFGVDNIPNTTELIDAQGNINYDRITTFSSIDYGFLVSYARKLKIEGLNLGVNAKVVRRTVGDFGGAWGFGADAGIQYNKNKWLFGLMARDITTTFNAWSYTLSDQTKNTFALTGNEIPENSLEITLPKLILGVSKKFSFFTNRFSVAPEANLMFTFDGKRNVVIKSDFTSIDPTLGLEMDYQNLIFFRAGIGNIQQTTDVTNKSVTTFQPNIGAGVKIKGVTLDYALTDIGDRSIALYSNVFSLKIDINKRVNKT